jgi:hypothetical protein
MISPNLAASADDEYQFEVEKATRKMLEEYCQKMADQFNRTTSMIRLKEKTSCLCNAPSLGTEVGKCRAWPYSTFPTSFMDNAECLIYGLFLCS